MNPLYEHSKYLRQKKYKIKKEFLFCSFNFLSVYFCFFFLCSVLFSTMTALHQMLPIVVKIIQPKQTSTKKNIYFGIMKMKRNDDGTYTHTHTNCHEFALHKIHIQKFKSKSMNRNKQAIVVFCVHLFEMYRCIRNRKLSISTFLINVCVFFFFHLF